MNEPKRREQRRTHLDASVVPVERALLARAEALEASPVTTFGGSAAIAGSGGPGGAGHGGGSGGLGGQGGSVVVSGGAWSGGGGGGGYSSGPGFIAYIVANEFRALAEELHWW